MSKISRIWSRQIIDSRAIPTVETFCQLETGHITSFSVPSGASTGTYEAVDLRDMDKNHFLGMSVGKAVDNVNNILGPSVVGMSVLNQVEIDRKLIALDGTQNKSKYGANAILSVSGCVAKAASAVQNLPLYVWISKIFYGQSPAPSFRIPTPLFNLINGGLHGSGNLDFQEFHVIPASTKPYSDSLRCGVEIYITIGKNLERKGAIHSVGDEGGYAPNLFTNADALEVIVESIRESNYQLGRDVFLGLDVAASVFYSNGEYTIRDKSTPMNDMAFLEYYKTLNSQYHLSHIEDPFHEDAWDSWRKISGEMAGQATIVGDDLLVTNPQRVQKAVAEGACNGILVKPNQIGTVTETLEVIKMARDAKWVVIVSHRSGETNDDFIADFAVGMGADYVKFGAPARGERVAKYNRLLTIESQLRASSRQ